MGRLGNGALTGRLAAPTAPLNGVTGVTPTVPYRVNGTGALAWALLAVAAPLLGGCAAFSATTLRCGVDADASYVELVNIPSSLSNARTYAELCGFSFDQAEKLRLDNGGHVVALED